MTFAMLAGHTVSGDASAASECSWYFVQYNVDNALGVPLTMAIHAVIVMSATSWMKRKTVKEDQMHGQWSFVEIVASCGNYGSPAKVSTSHVMLQRLRTFGVGVLVGSASDGMDSVCDCCQKCEWPLGDGIG